MGQSVEADSPESSPDGYNFIGEKFPIVETCLLCGARITTGHYQERQIVINGIIFTSGLEVVDHEMSICYPCPNGEDGRHAINGM